MIGRSVFSLLPNLIMVKFKCGMMLDSKLTKQEGFDQPCFYSDSSWFPECHGTILGFQRKDCRSP